MDTNYINILESKTLGQIHRFAISAALNRKESITNIAKELGFTRKTIHNEINRGTITQRRSDLTEYKIYDIYAATYAYERSLSFRGRLSKIDDDKTLLDVVKSLLSEGCSPEVIEHIIKTDESIITKVCYSTIYNWVYNGSLGLDYTSLPYGKEKRSKKRKKGKKMELPNGGESIDNRKDISDREEFGHWEIDCVVGKREGKSTSLMTLVERKTRMGIIIKIPSKSKKHIVNALKKVKAKFGKLFYDIFLSITADNGSEFKDALGMSLKLKNGKQVKIYFAHAYCSWQRGTNENYNKMIRRIFPKGTDFTKVTNKQIDDACTWINNYLRKSFKFQTSESLFNIELSKFNKN